MEKTSDNFKPGLDRSREQGAGIALDQQYTDFQGISIDISYMVM
jgi:hypothetical protein